MTCTCRYSYYSRYHRKCEFCLCVINNMCFVGYHLCVHVLYVIMHVCGMLLRECGLGLVVEGDVTGEFVTSDGDVVVEFLGLVFFASWR